MNIEQRLAEAIRSFSLDALAVAVPLNVDLDVVLSVLAHTVCAALRRRLPGYHTATPDTVTVRLSPPHLFTRCSAKPTYHRALAGQPHPSASSTNSKSWSLCARRARKEVLQEGRHRQRPSRAWRSSGLLLLL